RPREDQRRRPRQHGQRPARIGRDRYQLIDRRLPPDGASLFRLWMDAGTTPLSAAWASLLRWPSASKASQHERQGVASIRRGLLLVEEDGKRRPKAPFFVSRKCAVRAPRRSPPRPCRCRCTW